jgi:RHS repeat-associated protein
LTPSINSDKITLAGDIMIGNIACCSLGSSRRKSRIFSIREECCFYVADNEYGYYLPNGTKVSHPFGMLVQQTFGEQGHITVRISKQIFNNVPAIRYTIATFDPNQSNPDTLYQGGSSAADVFPGTNEVFGGEINGYGEIGIGGIGIAQSYTIYYVYDGINPIVEYTPNGSVKKKYVYAGGRHIATIAGADTNYYHCDALGSVRRVTNENGTSKWNTHYYPFGEMFQTQGSGNTHTFTGKEWDAEMDLNYFCQRYYDPEIGRFMARDPIRRSASSPYAYCANNPLKFIDPTGAAMQVHIIMTGDRACQSDYTGMGWHKYNPWTARLSQFDPDFWSPGWDWSPYHNNAAFDFGSTYLLLRKNRYPSNLSEQGATHGESGGTDMVLDLSEDALNFYEMINEGNYLGTGLGDYATEWWAMESLDPTNSWFETGGYWLGGSLAALWLPETWKSTLGTLGFAYMVRVLGPFPQQGTPGFLDRMRECIRFDPPHHNQGWHFDGDWWPWQ